MTKVEQLKLNGQLPSPKGVALAIIKLCRRDDVTVNEVALAIQPDPALTGRLIRMANAGGRGKRPVASIRDAVTLLGFATVRQLALGFSLLDEYRAGNCKAFDYHAYWSGSLLMALGMQTFSGRARAGSPDELFACGLLARIGQLALATVYPLEYQQVLEIWRTDTSQDLRMMEREHLAVDHGELGAAMLADWGMPKVLVEAVFHHDNLESADLSADSRARDLAHLLHLASHLADLGVVAEPERPRRARDLLGLAGNIGLTAEAMSTWIDGVLAEWREWGRALNVPAKALPPFAELARSGSDEAGEPGEEGAVSPLRVLIVDESPSNRQPLEKALHETVGCAVIGTADGRDALAMALEFLPQVIVTNSHLPEMSGIELCRALRSSELGQAIYIMMLAPSADEDHMIEAFEAGVDQYAFRPISARDLVARLNAARRVVALREEWEQDRTRMRHITAELAIANRRLAHAALTDLLTELPNRRAAMDRLQAAWGAADRSSQALSVMVIDLDHFKRINDTYGHAIGDAVLKAVAAILRHSARKNDSVCRIGGEEFLIICESAPLEAAFLSAERLRETLSANRVQVGGFTFPVTISVGVATKTAAMRNEDALVRAADKALYDAKNAGRNRVFKASSKAAAMSNGGGW